MIEFKAIIKNLLKVVSFCILLSITAIAQQTDNGALTGTITDPNGAIVPGATVTVLSLETNQSRRTTANDEGRWTVGALKLGNYEVTATSAGFQDAKETAAVSASVTTEVNLILTITAQEVVDVLPPSEQSSVIGTDSGGAVTSTFKGRDIESLPIPNRSTLTLIQINTQTSAEIADPIGVGGGNPEGSIAGGRTTSVGLIIDGVDATNLVGTGSLTENISPAPEFVKEVKLSTSNYDASLGRTGGGNVQIVTRNGGQKFSGTAFIYAQNEAFNANDFFFNRDGIDRQQARKLEGGFSLGGPIIKERLFFFGGYQKTDVSTAYVPSAQSLVVLPEALALLTSRTPQDVANAFGNARGDFPLSGFFLPGCARSQVFVPGPNLNFPCVNALSPFYRLLSQRNPVTGDFVIPTLRPGYERLFSNPANTLITSAADRALFPDNRIRLFDVGPSEAPGGNPLVRQRNASPAQFKQDQFTTRLDYALLKGDAEGNNANNLSGTFFFANFPITEPFPDSTLVSPFPLVRDDRNRTLAITDTHIIDAESNFINEARFGYFFLNNTRELDPRLLQPEFTNSGLGIPSPASFFVPGEATQRCARQAGRFNLQDFSVCAPNDIFNRREQITLTIADNVTYIRGNHTFRFGVEHKRNSFDTNLPEEQGVEFEKYDGFGQLLAGLVPEADTAFGITDKEFRFNDLSFYVSDEWRVNNRLTLSLGLRWDWFGRPFEKNGQFSNFDPALLTNPDDPRPGFILPSNAGQTGFNAIDTSLSSLTVSDNKHTLNGQDLNNFAPRVGFRYDVFGTGKTLVSGAYGIFYDRPSASFINTVYSNYPYLREIEENLETRPFGIPFNLVFRGQSPTRPFSQSLPYRVDFSQATGPAYFLTDSNQPLGSQNFAEPLEFRAVDRDLQTPLVQQWNLGIQQRFGEDWAVETRYVGTRGQQLLLAVGFNQAYDLNDPNTPDYIFGRINEAYLRGGATQGPLRTGAGSERQRGCGIAFGLGYSVSSGFGVPQTPGFDYPFGPACNGQGQFEYNLDTLQGVALNLIDAELRVPYLGLDPVDAVMLQSRGYSFYHSGQVNVSKRLSNSYSLNLSYTFSKSIDIGSTDPGSTTASGRPDTPNLGLVVQGDQRDLNSNRAVSDFDRPHRFAGSFTYELPTFGINSAFTNGWQISGFGQWQSGSPFTILATDAEIFNIANEGQVIQGIFLGEFSAGGRSRLGNNPNRLIYSPGRTAGLLFNAAFGRPNLRGSLDLLRQRNCDDPTRCYFNTNLRTDDPNAALAATYGRFGNLGRNTLRGPSQKRVDISLQKSTKFTERISLELKWDIFNVFNLVNFANPNADLTDESDFGQITRTVGAPRVMQFGAKLRF